MAKWCEVVGELTYGVPVVVLLVLSTVVTSPAPITIESLI